MSDIVFILGAGASVDAGAPVMKNFIDTARQLYFLNEIEHPEKFKIAFEGISKLQQVHSKSDIDLYNIESIFAAFEMAKIIRQFSDYSSENITHLFDCLKYVLISTIENTVLFDMNENGFSIKPVYKVFLDLVDFLCLKSNPKHTVSIITFNYDIYLDLVMFLRDKDSPAYYLNEHSGKYKLLKLHGSLNWGYCPNCKKVVP